MRKFYKGKVNVKHQNPVHTTACLGSSFWLHFFVQFICGMCIYFPQYVLQSQLNKATHTILCKTSMLYLGPSLSRTLRIYIIICVNLKERVLTTCGVQLKPEETPRPSLIFTLQSMTQLICGVWGDYQIQNNLHCPIAAGWTLLYYLISFFTVLFTL